MPVLWSHWHQVAGVLTSIDTGSRFGLSGAGRGRGPWFLNGCGVSVWRDEEVSEVGGGAGSTALECNECHWIVHLNTVRRQIARHTRFTTTENHCGCLVSGVVINLFCLNGGPLYLSPERKGHFCEHQRKGSRQRQCLLILETGRNKQHWSFSLHRCLLTTVSPSQLFITTTPGELTNCLYK